MAVIGFPVFFLILGKFNKKKNETEKPSYYVVER